MNKNTFVVLCAAALALTACRTPAAPMATRAPSATTTALEQRLRALPPTVHVRVGDQLAAMPQFPVDMPDGSAPTVNLPDLLKAQGKRAALLWFYQMDNTSW